MRQLVASTLDAQCAATHTTVTSLRHVAISVPTHPMPTPHSPRPTHMQHYDVPVPNVWAVFQPTNLLWIFTKKWVRATVDWQLGPQRVQRQANAAAEQQTCQQAPGTACLPMHAFQHIAPAVSTVP